GRWDPVRLAAALEQALAQLAVAASADLLRLCLLVPLRFADRSGSGPVARAIQSLLTKTPGLPGPGPAGSLWVEEALAALERQGAPAAIPRQFLRTFGEAGLDLAAAVAAGSAVAQAAKQAALRAGVETQCAGVFLLIRAMLDARLASVTHRAGYPLAPCIL